MAMLRYLALGDSYTIGTGSSGPGRTFPSLLAARLAAAGHRVEVTNPAVDGFTSEDLIREELPLLEGLHPDRVSVLIGANDVVRGRSATAYRSSLGFIYDAVRRLGPPGAHVVAVSVPDWSVAPAAARFGDPAAIRLRLVEINRIAEAEAGARGFAHVDITEVSRRPPAGLGWISADGLHPGDGQYAAWAEVIWERLASRWT